MHFIVGLLLIIGIAIMLFSKGYQSLENDEYGSDNGEDD